MSEQVLCPDCGALNPAGGEACSHCNYPLTDAIPAAPAKPREAAAEKPVEPAPAPAPAPAPPKPSAPVRGFDPGARPMRPRRARPDSMQPVQMQLWLVAGVAVVLGILYFAAQGFQKTNEPVIAGANPQLQQRADLARKTIERDSTNLMARIELANVLYDTANWSEAIIHYKSAMRLDPMRSTTVVDLGVCYYNLGQFAAAETLFTHALTLDPKQAIALFNLGIVAMSREQMAQATEYFHRALEANPPEEMKNLIMQNLEKTMSATGKTPPPLTK
ncbi:MAG: tetratricopeptide repeat protein [Candidatus Eisenbacteria bacterium]|nr:tetratricopeptide repeat protein [Candidatus Eisenbacteria bacterium]